MTIDEKLSHFYDITVEEAHEKAAAILDEHKAALEKMAEEHKTLSEENAQTQIKAETASAYLSPEDRSLAEKLQHTTGTAIQLAKDSFLGGIRATIPQKNILIDHSFAGNFEAAYKEFKFDGGPEHE